MVAKERERERVTTITLMHTDEGDGLTLCLISFASPSSQNSHHLPPTDRKTLLFLISLAINKEKKTRTKKIHQIKIKTERDIPESRCVSIEPCDEHFPGIKIFFTRPSLLYLHILSLIAQTIKYITTTTTQGNIAVRYYYYFFPSFPTFFLYQMERGSPYCRSFYVYTL